MQNGSAVRPPRSRAFPRMQIHLVLVLLLEVAQQPLDSTKLVRPQVNGLPDGPGEALTP